MLLNKKFLPFIAITSVFVFTFATEFINKRIAMAEQNNPISAEQRMRQEELMHQLSKRIVRRIERELFEREMSHKDFAELINHSQGVVSRWMNGKHNFTLSTLALISLALDIDVLEL